jgi:acyl-CoA thioesterase-1
MRMSNDTNQRAHQQPACRSEHRAASPDAGCRRTGRAAGRREIRPQASPGWLHTVTLLLVLASVACENGAGTARGRGSAPASGTRLIRVAAVGDSITHGSGLEDRARQNYPAQLGRLLGARYDVRNFGVAGRTLLRNGDEPYWTAAAFDEAQAFEPDVVIIMLGTNDTKPQNWRAFMADYAAMIGAFAALPSRPKIWICRPVPTFGWYGARDAVIRNEVIPRIDRVAEDRQVPIIDLYAVLEGRADLFPNGIHPNAEGARLIAENVAAAIQAARPARRPAARGSTDAGRKAGGHPV